MSHWRSGQHFYLQMRKLSPGEVRDPQWFTASECRIWTSTLDILIGSFITTIIIHWTGVVYRLFPKVILSENLFRLFIRIREDQHSTESTSGNTVIITPHLQTLSTPPTRPHYRWGNWDPKSLGWWLLCFVCILGGHRDLLKSQSLCHIQTNKSQSRGEKAQMPYFFEISQAISVGKQF